MADADPLAADRGLGRLVESLLLADDFEVHLLTCDEPRTAAAALDHIAERLRRAGHRRAARLAVPAGTLLDELATATPGRILIVDASGALPPDEPAWREVFRRLNERRNQIAARLEAPLVLCLTPTLEVVFAHEAPDFWSIRGRQITVSLAPAERDDRAPDSARDRVVPHN